MNKLHFSKRESEGLGELLADIITEYGLPIATEYNRCECCGRVIVHATLANGWQIEATLLSEGELHELDRSEATQGAERVN